ncbi:O-succinylbenzoate synthase [Actinobacteria bacterium YIM 96077]|uniref:o-succinylbenzoate synthase n=1 Tax=Phytoactinopolyspora halophila TaxID=1981511 RepID=A0A329QQT4_9ACTN|nr:o-succinylbenzoate synthase [Phytoactinopolyspora halophila]AYY14794.1 O-succinylbenzoate synthase [Actinobacteria bacterium YIM 96077]RAW13068.1 O-succinylbenzoate synthase [Phytoactinopolyspora halophila]
MRKLAGMRVYAIPMRARFRDIDVREGVLLRGSAGWAEFSPFREYDDAEARAWWSAAQEAAEIGWPAPIRDRIPVNATIPAVPPERVGGILSRFSGCTTAKVKIAAPGHPPAEDLDRLAAVRAALGPEGKIRIDANGSWEADTAIRLLPEYDRAAGGLEYAEQPCASVEELASVRRRVSVPIAADESIRRAEDPARVARHEAADIVVLKVQPMGGVRACLRIAEEIGRPVVVSSALETSIGIAAGVALAAALPRLEHACGLATVGLLERDVVADPLVAHDGALPVRRPEPQVELLAAVEADDATSAWWHRRVDRLRGRG